MLVLKRACEYHSRHQPRGHSTYTIREHPSRILDRKLHRRSASEKKVSRRIQHSFGTRHRLRMNKCQFDAARRCWSIDAQAKGQSLTIRASFCDIKSQRCFLCASEPWET